MAKPTGFPANEEHSNAVESIYENHGNGANPIVIDGELRIAAVGSTQAEDHSFIFFTLG